jgi:hypothetical protein
MDKLVIRQNIDHFREKLATETDEGRREMLFSLLADEEAKLAALEKTLPRKRRSF